MTDDSPRDTIPAPADRPTNPGQPDTVGGPMLDILDRIVTRLAILEAKQDEWGMQLVTKQGDILSNQHSLRRQNDELFREFSRLRMAQERFERRLDLIEARVELIEADDHGPNGSTPPSNGSMPPEQ